MNKKFGYYYTIEYASTMFTKKENKRVRVIGSNDYYSIGDFILIKKEKQGIFIGKIVERDTELYIDNEGYSIEMKINIDNFLIKESNRKLKAEIQKEMDKKIAEIDADLKLQLYANQNEEFAKLYEQYKNL